MNFEKLVYIHGELSQKEIADILGVSRAVYSKRKIDASIIPLKHLFHFYNYFQVSLDFCVRFISRKSEIGNKKKSNKKTIGNRLKELRKKKKITQQELASTLYTTQSTIREWKNFTINCFCLSNCVSMDWICGRTN